MSRDILENVTKETKTVTQGIWFKWKTITLLPHNILRRSSEYCKYKSNSFRLAWKYAPIFVRGHHLFRDANSLLIAKLEESCELRGTAYVPEQIHSIAKTLTPWKHKLWTMRPNGPSMLWAYFFSSNVFFIAKNKNSKLLIIMMEMRLLFKHYPQIRRVSSFTVYAFKVSTFLQLSVYKYCVYYPSNSFATHGYLTACCVGCLLFSVFCGVSYQQTNTSLFL